MIDPDQPDEANLRVSWRLRWLSSIHHFADREIQQTRWLDPAETNPHFSYVECMCVYFDDVMLGNDNAYADLVQRGWLSDQEVGSVREFHQAASKHESPSGDDWDAAAILADPKWQSVVALAERAQQKLSPLLTNQTERDALLRPEDWIAGRGVYNSTLTNATIVSLRDD